MVTLPNVFIDTGSVAKGIGLLLFAQKIA